MLIFDSSQLISQLDDEVSHVVASHGPDWDQRNLAHLSAEIASLPLLREVSSFFDNRAQYADRPTVRLGHDAHGPTVWLLGWRKGEATPIHDHVNSLAGITVVTGIVTEEMYVGIATGQSGVVSVSLRELYKGTVISLSVPYIHRMGNTDDELAVSLHCYYPPLVFMEKYDGPTFAKVYKQMHCILSAAGRWMDDELVAHQRTCAKCRTVTNG